MKTKFTNLRLIAVAFFLFALPFSVLADSYPLYLCGGATANLKPDVTVEAGLAVGDQVVWQEWSTADAPIGTATPLSVTVAGTAPVFTVSNSLSTGEHRFKVFIISASPNTCSGDVSPAFSLYVLPEATLALGTPSNASFCQGASNPTTQSSVIPANATAIAAALTDVSYAYTWTATKGGVAVGDVSTIGVASGNTFTLNNTAGAGAYIFTASIKYVVAAGVLKSGDTNGCVKTSAPSSTITVTPKPATPTIMIAP